MSVAVVPNTYRRALRLNAVAEGKCSSCCVHPPKPARKTCQPCIDYRRRNYHARRVTWERRLVANLARAAELCFADRIASRTAWHPGCGRAAPGWMEARR